MYEFLSFVIWVWEDKLGRIYCWGGFFVLELGVILDLEFGMIDNFGKVFVM